MKELKPAPGLSQRGPHCGPHGAETAPFHPRRRMTWTR